MGMKSSRILKESLLISFLLSLLLSAVVLGATNTGLSVAYATSIGNNGSFSTIMTLQDPANSIFTLGFTEYQQVIFLTVNGQNGYAIVSVVQVCPLNTFWNGWVELWSAYIGSSGTVQLESEIGQVQTPNFAVGSSYNANVSGYDISGTISIVAMGKNIGAANFANGSIIEIYATPGLQLSYSSGQISGSTTVAASSSSTATSTSTAVAGSSSQSSTIAGQENSITIAGGITVSQQKAIEYALLGVAFLFLLVIVVAVAKR